MSGPAAELADLREHLKRYRDVTLQTLEFVPDDKLSWSPGAGLRTFAEQFLHVAQAENFHSRGLLTGEYDFNQLKPPGEPLTRDALRQRLSDAHAFTDEKLASLDAGKLDEVMKVPNVPVAWSLRSWLWYLVEHEIHHKAQLAMYLRQIGITPPFFAFVFPRGVRPDVS
ncbi:MAG TPA: DinB family protein [Blastocatellia bacterium]|jgi:uncharacterized damage-inducible protein DinB